MEERYVIGCYPRASLRGRWVADCKRCDERIRRRTLLDLAGAVAAHDDVGCPASGRR